MSSRPGKDQYYLNIAREVCRRGTCLRRQYGAVIVNDDQIVATGYAGAPRGVANCVDLGVCLREELEVPPGERYELCRSVHAEMNAVLHAARERTLGGVMYLFGLEVKSGQPTANPEPCQLCRRVIINAGIERVVVQPAGQDLKNLYPADWIEEENQEAKRRMAARAFNTSAQATEGEGIK